MAVTSHSNDATQPSSRGTPSAWPGENGTPAKRAPGSASLAANRAVYARCSSLSTFTPNRRSVPTSSRVRPPARSVVSSSGGAACSAHAMPVHPCGRPSSSVVMTATPVASLPNPARIARACSSVIGLVGPSGGIVTSCPDKSPKGARGSIL